MDDDLTKWPTHADLAASSDVPANVRRRWLPSMWPPPPATAAALKLERCLRLLPHLADMGGFFVVLLRKVAPLLGPPARRRLLARMAWSPGGLGDTSQESAGAGARRATALKVAEIGEKCDGVRLRSRRCRRRAKRGDMPSLAARRATSPCRPRARRRCGSSSGYARARGRCCVHCCAPAAAPPSSVTRAQLQPMAAAAAGGGGSALRLLSAGCTFARRSRRGVYAPHARGRRAAPHAKRKRALVPAPPTAASSSSSRRARSPPRASRPRPPPLRAGCRPAPAWCCCGPRTAARASRCPPAGCAATTACASRSERRPASSSAPPRLRTR